MLWPRRDGYVVENQAVGDIIAFVFVAFVLEFSEGLARPGGVPTTPARPLRKAGVSGVW